MNAVVEQRQEIAVPFDWRNPDHLPVYAARAERLRRIRATPSMLPALHEHYREHPAQFISDWGMSFDPRNSERGLPTTIPFVLFPKQEEWIYWVLERWRNQEPGLTEKSRDSGLSWLAVALGCTLCLFRQGIVIGYGSRKVEYVDSLGSPRSLFAKARMFLSHLPTEFLGGFDLERHAPHMRIQFPGTGSILTGEGGDSIGRGDRSSLYFVDEAAFLERPELVDAALSATTNCRIDISTPNGQANPFAQKRMSGRIKVFSFHWRDDPRKSEAWYANQCAQLDSLTIAREIDINYSDSVANTVIPSEWIQSAIGAHIKLGIEPTGFKRASLDVADQGQDDCSMAFRNGILLQHLHSWSGKSSDIYQSVVRAAALCDAYGHQDFAYDADGLGSGVRGDMNRLNEDRHKLGQPRIHTDAFRGSAAVDDPEGQMVRERRNKDLFANRKAQAWWALRERFKATHRAIVDKLPWVADNLISIDPQLEELTGLIIELSQPTFSLNSVGKILVNKAPDGTRSPNRADAVMICFGSGVSYIQVWAALGPRWRS